MEIDYIKGTFFPYNPDCYVPLLLNDVPIRSEHIFDVQKVVFSFFEKELEFVCLSTFRRFFFYQNERAYLEILKLMYDHPEAVKPLLLKYYSASGLMKDLLVCLYSAMCSRFHTKGYEHLKNCVKYEARPNYFELSEVFDPSDQRDERPIRSSIDNLYEALCFLLPQNLPKKRAEIAEQERITQKKEAAILADTIRETYDRTTGFSQLFESIRISEKNGPDTLYQAVTHMEQQKQDVQKYQKGNYITSEEAAELVEIINEAIATLLGWVQSAVDKQRTNEFGTISELKTKFRTSIHKLQFPELLELFRDYKKQEAAFLRRKEAAKHSIENASYDPYINLYRYGGILISDRMNQLNRNKAKHKHIPQDLLDEAMQFYYDADSIAAAYETQRKEKYSQEKESGDIGEGRVKEALRWLDSSYVQIQPLSKDCSNNACIYLQNLDYINVRQEYDHILVGKTGVFVIETKNYAGRLIVDKYGNWRRIQHDGKEVGVKNPLEQVRKHEKVLRSFLGENISLISIICIANDSAIIEGIENCPVPIIKSDALVEFVEHYENQKPPLTADEIQSCVNSIYDHMLKS